MIRWAKLVAEIAVSWAIAYDAIMALAQMLGLGG